MRRSAHVFAPLLASAAVLLAAGCRHGEPERCVDEQNRVVDPKFCANQPPGSQQPVAGTPGNSGGYYNSNHIWVPFLYRRYYGGGGGFVPGSTVTGGTYAPVPGRSYSFGRGASASGTSRGGFGSSFSSHGGGGGE